MPTSDLQPPAAATALLAAVYDQLCELTALYMTGGRGTVLQATALVHEVFIRLARSGSGVWNDEAHFGAVAATVMRRVLVDELRRATREKRGGGREWVGSSRDAHRPAGHRP